MGRNPATGATINIPAKTVVKMRIKKLLPRMVRERGAEPLKVTPLDPKLGGVLTKIRSLPAGRRTVQEKARFREVFLGLKVGQGLFWDGREGLLFFRPDAGRIHGFPSASRLEIPFSKGPSPLF